MKTIIATLAGAVLSVLPALADSPILEDGSIRIKPGDSFVVQFERAGSKLIKPVIVEKFTEHPCVQIQCASTFSPKTIAPEKPGDLLVFMMGEMPNHTIMSIHKKIADKIEYKCLVKPEGQANLEKRNNFVLEQNFPILEQYPQKLDKLILSEFQTR